MVPFQPMSESEMQVMRILWDSPEPVISAQVIEQLSHSKQWKPSTVWTFLGRLVEKGYITAKKVGKRSFYSPALSEAQYREAQTKHFLDSVHGGSMQSFFAALSGGTMLSADDLAELKKWLSKEMDGEQS